MSPSAVPSTGGDGRRFEVTDFLSAGASGAGRPLRGVLEDLAAAVEAEAPSIAAELSSLRDPTEAAAQRVDRKRVRLRQQQATLADLALPRWRLLAQHRVPGEAGNRVMAGRSLFRAGVAAVLFPIMSACAPAERARAARAEQAAEFSSLLQFFHEDVRARIGRAIALPVASACADEDLDFAALAGDGFWGAAAASDALRKLIEAVAGSRRRRCAACVAV